jgi:hypothetical protein
MTINSIVKRGLATTLLFAGLAASWSACTTIPTEIVAGMTTQIQVPKELKAVGIVMRYGSQLIFCKAYPVVDGSVTLPSTLGFAPQEARADEVLEPLTISVLGFRTEQGEDFDQNCIVSVADADSDEVMVVRRSRTPYIPDRILYLPMPLKESCSNVPCPDDQTCIGGLCETIDVDAEKLVEYRDSLIFGRGGTCFSPKLCLPSAATQPAILVDPADCTFKFPVPPDTSPPPTTPGNLNVEVVYNTFGTEILDLDDKEGFVFPDENDPLTFRLASNLCASNYKTGRIVAITAAPVCPAKRALQPICDDELAGIQAGMRSPTGGVTSAEGLCTFADPLVSTESALYVLMDSSAAMAEFFGPDGLQFAVETPLENPLAARIRIAFSFVPAAASGCMGANSFLMPDFGFDDVDVVRQPIADALGDVGSLQPDNPQIFLDVALKGAHQALAALTPTTSALFNRRAMVIVGNRDFQQHCGGDDVATIAQTARTDDDIFTYAAVLDAPPGAPQFGDNPVASATAIATAGGTQVIDAVGDEAEGALAVQKIISDLGSCVYDPQSLIVAGTDTFLSYVHPVTLTRTDIAFESGCQNEGTSAAGWNVDDSGAIRICGQPCDALRDDLTDVAKTFAALGETAPAVPIVATHPCLP